MNLQSQQGLKQFAKAHLANNKIEEARKALLQASKLDDKDAEIWYLLGRIESSLDCPERAIRYYEKAVHLNHLSAPAYFHQALAQIDLGQLNKAASSLEKCLAINEAFPYAHLRISAVYERLGLRDKAVRHAESVLEKEPNNIEALNRLARVKTFLGALEEARRYYQLVLSETPDDVHAAAGLAGLHVKRGEIEQAVALIEPFLDSGSTPNAIAFLFSDICQFTGQCEEAAGVIEGILQRSTEPRARHRRLIYALAKLYDRLQQFDKAFETVSEANKLKQAEAGTPVIADQAGRLIRIWTSEFNARLPVSNAKAGSIEPIFIVGMPRSGTSLTEQILASHPEVYGAGELTMIDDIRGKYFGIAGTNSGYPDCLQTATDSVMNESRKECLGQLSSLAGSGYRMVTDKMPENFWNLGLIRLIFPAAKIIHCIRNPLDTCISCYFTDFRDGHEYSCDLSSLGVYYRQYQKVMRHWKYALRIPLFEVRYEDLVDNAEETSRTLVDYCGLEWDSRCLNSHKTRRDVNTASFAQVRHKIYTSSVERWKSYDKYIALLRESIDV